MIMLVATEVIFFSQGDESAFFSWLTGISCVNEVRGVGKDLQIEIRDEVITDADLRELIALFHRYAIRSSQLARLKTDANAWWFQNAQGYWHRSVFG